MIISILLILTSILISLIGIVYVYLNRENFGDTLSINLNMLLFLFLGIFFFSSFLLSTDVSLNEDVVLILWYFSIIFWVFSIGILSVTQKFVIKFEEKTILITIFYSLIIGMILGLSFLSNSFTINLNSNSYKFIFQNLLLLYLLLSYNIIIIIVMCYNLIRYFMRLRDSTSQKIISILTLQFSFLILLYSIYIITQNITFRYLYAIFYLIGAILASYFIITKPFLFIELTNKIHDFIIFHRSGILLYSYNFETGQETDESLLKGSILIGINHILSNFIDKKDQLNLIKMKNRDIIFEYDNTHGYALLLTANHKNKFIDKAVNSFMTKFTSLNGEKLKNLNGLIDVSEFRNAKEIIIENFEPFIIKNNQIKKKSLFINRV